MFQSLVGVNALNWWHLPRGCHSVHLKKMDGYDSGEDLFLMQSNFRRDEDINTQQAIEAVDSLDQFLDYVYRQLSNGEPVMLAFPINRKFIRIDQRYSA